MLLCCLQFEVELWKAGSFELNVCGLQCGLGSIFLSKSDQFWMSSIWARPVSNSHSVFVWYQTETDTFLSWWTKFVSHYCLLWLQHVYWGYTCILTIRTLKVSHWLYSNSVISHWLSSPFLNLDYYYTIIIRECDIDWPTLRFWKPCPTLMVMLVFIVTPNLHQSGADRIPF